MPDTVRNRKMRRCEQDKEGEDFPMGAYMVVRKQGKHSLTKYCDVYTRFLVSFDI